MLYLIQFINSHPAMVNVDWWDALHFPIFTSTMLHLLTPILFQNASLSLSGLASQS